LLLLLQAQLQAVKRNNKAGAAPATLQLLAGK
jgi:hypothetical protein